MRDKLKTAMRGGDKDTLGGVISECVAAGMPELDSVIQEARRTLIATEYPEARGALFVYNVISML